MASMSKSIPINTAKRPARSLQADGSIEQFDEKEETLPNAGMSESYSEILNLDFPLQVKSTENSRYEHRKTTSESNSTDDEPPTGGTLDSEPSASDQRPKSLVCDNMFPYNLEGTVSKEGDVTNFVAKDLEQKIRLSSPSTKNSPTHYSTSPSTSGLTRQFLSSQAKLPQIDSNVLNDIEVEAQYLAASADSLIENLGNLLHSISSITRDNVEVHRNAVTKLTDCMDANIKIMYTIMAKTEEITESMKPTEQLAQRIQQIKRFVDMLESNL